MRNIYTTLLAYLLFTCRLFSQPVIHSLDPAAGAVGTTVTINGNGFSPITADNIVYFGAAKAVVSTATENMLQAVVPAGATYSRVTVITNNLVAYSNNAFVVSFDGDGGPFTPNSFIPKVDFITGNYPHSVLFADFNNDNKNDLLVTRGSSQDVTVLQNTSVNGNLSFAPALNFAATGFSHEGSAIADFDGDGKPDFVITNSHNVHSVSVFRNTSTVNLLSFAPRIDLPADNSPYSVSAGDLDQDGKPDMIIINSGTGSDKVSVYKNTSAPGNISFEARKDFATGTSPFAVAVADLDGDGKPELAITTQYITSSLSVMKNTTAGGVISFQAPVDLATFPAPFDVGIGDLDLDGKPDLVAAAAGLNAVVVMRNTTVSENIAFAPAQYFNTANYPRGISISDLNGDGKPDLATSNQYANNVSVLRNTSTTGSISFGEAINYAVGEAPIYLATGDLDGDQRPDIVTANSSANNVSILRNFNDADVAPVITSFSPSTAKTGDSISIRGKNFSEVTTVNFGDVPATSFVIDSATGITAVVGAGASGAISVSSAYGTATLAGFNFIGPIVNSFSPTIGNPGTSVTIYGVNFIDVTDVKFGGTSAASFTIISPTMITAIVGEGSPGSVTVITANGIAELPGFSFGAPVITNVSPVNGLVGSSVTITGYNFNADPAANTVFFGAVRASVTAASATQLVVNVPPGATYEPVSVTTNNLTAYASYPFSTSFETDSTQITGNSFSRIADFGSGAYPFAIAIGDLDNDGKPDILTANSVANTISILKNVSVDGIASFSNKVDLNSGPDPKRIAVGDLNGDGKKDIVVTNMNAGNQSTISVFRNMTSGGDILFSTKMDYSSGNGSIGLAMADMNGDGKPDLVVTSGNSGIFSIFVNTTIGAGEISFAPKQDFTLFTHPDNLAIADLDNDGRPDIIISGFSHRVISIYRNTSTGGNLSLGSRIDYETGLHPTYVATGDLNMDGKIDILVSNYSTGNISVFKNTGNSGFISMETPAALPIAATNIIVADLNGDGKPDLLTGKGLNGNISVHENQYTGSAGFDFGNPVDFITGNYDTFVSAADLDGDGRPELAIANTTNNSVTILKNAIGLPAIENISADTAVEGVTVVLNGRRFSEATDISFGGTPARSFEVISDKEINAVLGGGASGNIVVTTPAGKAFIPGFKFIPGITVTGSTNFCAGESVTLTSSADNNNQWFKDGNAINGATAKDLQVLIGGKYSVSTTSNNITTRSADTVVVTVKSVPVPTITRNTNNQLVSSAAEGNQWFLDGNMIPGATSPIYQPSVNGSYAVASTVNGCTSSLSNAYNYVITGIINLGNGQYIKIYPNPVKDRLNINWNIAGTPKLNIEVTDILGRVLLRAGTVQTGKLLDLSGFPPGLYFIKIDSKQFKIHEILKIVKE